MQIVFAVDEFEDATATRTVVTDIDKGTINWVLGDVIGIFPYEGFQEPFAIPETEVDQQYALYDGGYWDLKEGLCYNAYYPFNIDNFAAWDMKERIPVSYHGQSQAGADGIGNINTGSYDFTYSEWQAAPAEGQITFNFHHIGCLLVLNVTCPFNSLYTTMAISTASEAGNNLIPAEGTFDLTYNKDKEPEYGSSYVKIPYVPVESAMASRLEMSITNVAGTEGLTCVKGRVYQLYMMMPPVDLTADGILTTFEITDGYTTYSCTMAPTNFQSGRKYTFNLNPVADQNADVGFSTGIGDWNEVNGSGNTTPEFE